MTADIHVYVVTKRIKYVVESSYYVFKPYSWQNFKVIDLSYVSWLALKVHLHRSCTIQIHTT